MAFTSKVHSEQLAVNQTSFGHLVNWEGESMLATKRFRSLSKIVITLLIAPFLLNTISAPTASAALLSATTSTTGLINPAGGSDSGWSSCPADAVVVGFRWSGSTAASAPYSIYCRTLNSDGTIASDAHTTSNTTAVSVYNGTGATNVEWCPDGTIATGVRHRGWADFALVCNTPPGLGSAASYSSVITTPTDNLCAAKSVMMGMGKWTGAWLDSLYGVCKAFGTATLSYNVNTGSGTAPASSAILIISPTTTTATTYTGTKTGFTFAGWNTLATGLGTHYDAGDSINVTAATTLYAQWNSTITYNGNTNTGGTAPDPTTVYGTSATTVLATNSGTLTKTGYTFAGWNTAANGSGTSYPVPTPSTFIDASYRHFTAANYNATTKTWVDDSGNSGNITSAYVRGSPTVVTNAANTNGAAASFQAVKGATTDGIQIRNAALNNYTFCHVARYAGATRARIFAGTTGNWLSGFWNSGAGVAYHEGWITSSAGVNDTNWKVQCDTGSTTAGSSSLRYNGSNVTTTTANATGLPANISINLQGSTTAPAETSDWEVAEFYIFDSVLSNAKIDQLQGILAHKYGVTASTFTQGTTNYTSTGNITLYAQWNSTITFNGNGNTSASTTVPASILSKGSANITLPAPTTLLRTNYTFAGWNTAANGSGTNYASGLTTYQSPGDTTLYAQWNSTISFNANGATGGAAPSAMTFVGDVAQNLPGNTASMSRLGFSFTGWNTAADGSGTAYSAGTSYTSTGTKTLYAQWQLTNSGLTPGFNTNTNSVIGVSSSGSVTINTAYTNSANDLVLADMPNQIQVIATVPVGTLQIVTTTNLTLPAGYQSALGTAAATISFIGTLTDINNALNSLKYIAPTTATTTEIKIYAAYVGDGSTRYNPDTGHYYNKETTTNLNWSTTFAKTTANSNCGISFNNLCGYLVTVNNAAETTYLVSTGLANSSWTGMWAGYTNNNASPYTTADCTGGCTFKYVPNAPTGEAGVTITYTNWNSGEPNGGNTPYSVIEMNSAGVWNDNTSITSCCTNGRLGLYEYGGKGETATFAALSRTIQIGVVAAPAAPDLAVGSDTGSSSTDNKTNDNTPDISLTGLTVGATVTFTFTPATGSAITYSFTVTNASQTFTMPSALPDGTYSITAAQSIGGATSAASTALSGVVIDTVGPTTTITSTVASGSVTTQKTAFTITVTFSDTVSGFTIDEAVNDAGSTAWVKGTTLTGSTTTYTFTETNANGTSGTAGILKISVGANVAQDVYGNNNSAATDFVLNEVAVVTFGNTGFNSGTAPTALTQTSSTSSINLPGAGTLVKTGNNFGGWSTNGSAPALSSPYTPTASVTLLPIWSPAVYVVTYDVNGGTGAPATSSQNFTYGTVTPLAPSAKGTMARTGYTFGGWSTTQVASGTIYSNSSDSIASTTTTYTPTASITFYAKWIAGTFAITFDANTGTGSINNQNFTAGTAFTLTSNAFTKAGYVFAGWNTAANGSGTSYTNAQSVTLYGAKTLYAQWTPAAPGTPTALSVTQGNGQVTVSATAAALSGTTSGPSTSFTITALDSMGAAISPSKSCTYSSPATSCVIDGLTNGTAYKFQVIATNSTGTSSAFTTSGTTSPAGYVVTYNANNSTTNTTATFNVGTPLTLPLPSKSGYVFSGWYAEIGLSTLIGTEGASYSPSSATTLYAKWTGISYSITYNGNGNTGGSVPSSGSYVNGGTAYSVVGNTNSLVKTGYTFSKWNTKPDGTGTDYEVTSATYSSAADITLYAKWIADTYTITYDGNGGGTPTKTSDSFTYGGNAVTLPGVQNLVKAGYSFNGWIKSGETATVTSPFIPTGNVTLYAYWVGNTYSVNFDVNGASGTASNTSYQAGTTGLTLPSGSGLTRTGYVFGGWSTTADGANLVTSPYTTAADVTLFAKWTPKTITVTYVKGLAGGTAPNPNTFPANTTSTYGSQFTLNSTIDSITAGASGNFAFVGWNDGNTTYGGGANYPVGVDNLTFTAQWVAIYTVHYNLNGGTGTVPADHTYLNGASITTPADPTRIGYDFAGWVDQSGNTVAGATATTVSDTRYIFGATWNPQNLAITFDKNGSTGTLSDTSVQYGSTYSLPSASGLTAPNGTIFDGWLIGSSKYGAGASIVVTSAISAIPQWKNNNFSIFFDLNGGDGTTPAALSGTTNNTVNLPTNPSRTGYVFGGWSVAGTPISISTTSATIGSANATYIASWTLAAPRIPTISNVAAGDGSATITVAPNASGGSPASYTITASPDGATCTVIAPATSCTVAPLTNGTSYSFTATATNSTGTSSASATSSSVTPAGKPSNPTGVSAVAGNTQAVVSFSPPTSNGGATIQSYSITATPVGGGTPITITGTSSPVTVTGLSNGTAYTFAVTASNGAGTSNSSTSSSSVTPATNPGAPTGVTPTSTTSGSTSIAFTAPASNGGSAITSYTVTATPVGGGTAITASGASSPISVTGLTDGVAYDYSVVATNGVGNSASASAASSLTTQGLASAPSSVSAVAGSGSAVVTFSGTSANGSTITAYTVTAYDPTGTATTDTCTVTTSATSGSCTVSGLTNGTAYTFKVTTTSTANGSSSTSSSSSAYGSATPASAPDAPSIGTPASGDNKVTVNWSQGATNGATISGYTVTAYDASGGALSPAITCSAAAGATSCDVTGLSVGANYTFKVVANASPADSSASSLSTAENMNSKPSQPVAPTAVAGNGRATVSITEPQSNGYAITSYTVTSSPDGKTCTVIAPATSCTVTGLTNGTAYTFSYTATNALGTSISSSASTSITPSTVPDKPTSVTGSPADGGAVVSWTAPSNNGSSITGYTVTSSPDGKTCTTSGTSCTVSGLTNGTAYTFTVVATNANGNSNPSASSSPVVPAKGPDAPTSVTATAGANKVVVSWTAPSDNGSSITGYTVQAYDASGNPVSGATCTATGSQTTCDVSNNLVVGQSYTFEVTATNAVSTSASSSPSGTASMNSAPSSPQSVSATAGAASATVSWSAPANTNGSAITGYTVQAYDSNNQAVSGATCTTSSTSCSVSGLTNGSAYTFKVTATNGIGTSASSSPSSAVTPSTVPSAPNSVTAAAHDQSATVSFTPASNGGSAITGYTVTASPGGATCTTTSTSCTVSNLTNGTTYTFTVVASNGNGDSSPSNASTGATPAAQFAPSPTDVQIPFPTGSPYAGSTLTSAAQYSGAPTPTITYQWQVCTSELDLSTCTDISGATSATYVPTISEVGKFVRVVTTAANGLSPNSVDASSVTEIINPAITYVAPTTGLTGTVGSAFSLSTSATGGVGPFTYAVTTGTLPSGLALNSNQGQITGTPTAAGTSNITITATDSNNVTKSISVALTISAAASSGGGGGSSSSSSASSSSTANTCDSVCQADKNAANAANQASSNQAAADAAAKAAADAAAKAAADAAALAAAQKAIATQQTLADQAAAQAAAATAAQKAAAAQAAAAQAAAIAAAQKAAQLAAAAKTAPAASSTAAKAAVAAAQAQAAALNSQAAAAVKAAATAAAQAAATAAASAAAQKNLGIQITNVKVNTSISSQSATAAATAAATASAQKAAAQAAQTAAQQAAATAKAAADAAAKAAADAATAKALADAAAAKAAAEAISQQKAAAKAASEKAAADKAAADAAAALAAAAQAASKLATSVTTAATAEEKAVAQTALESANVKVAQAQVTADNTKQAVEVKAQVLESATQAAAAATANVEVKAAAAEEAAQVAATKNVESQAAQSVVVSVAAQVAAATKAATVAATTAAAAVAAAAVAAKIQTKTTTQGKSSAATNAKVTINNLKPGQRIKVTVVSKK